VGVCKVELAAGFEEDHTYAHTLETLVCPMGYQGRLIIQSVEKNGDSALIFKQG
jgi:hypothetical protein